MYKRQLQLTWSYIQLDSVHSEDDTRTNQDEDEARRFRSINSNGDEHSEDG